MKIFRSIFLTAFALAFNSAVSHAVTVDGVLTDWQVNPGAYGSSDWTPAAGILYAEEDQNPSIDYLNPGYGGQKFDVEAMYFTRDENFAYFAIVSGFPLEGRDYLGDKYTAGDVAFDFGSDGSYEFGLETTGANRGKLYGNAAWTDPIFKICGPFDLKSGTLLGSAAFAYDKTTYITNGHYVFEFGLPISLFGAYWADPFTTPEFTMHWTMNCGNDCLRLNVPFSTIPHSPEPSTYVLMLIGMAGLFALNKIRRA